MTFDRFRKRVMPAFLTLAIPAFVFALVTYYDSSQWAKPRIALAADETEQVRRVSLDLSVNAPGEILSSENTTVECEIERLAVYAGGRAMVSGASTRILTLIPDGSIVKKGDILCELDRSAYEEAVRLQKINLEQAVAMQRYTEMDLEVSKISLEEYRLGSATRQIQAFKQQIALASAEASRTTGRLGWARKMYAKGYLSSNTVRAEELALQRSDMQLSRAQIALDTFEKYTNPRTEHSFQSRLLSQNWLLTYYKKNVEAQQKRLELFERQVANCTVRAPHDGLVIYANEDDGDTRVEEGSEIRYKQDLFYLPDLGKMQVLAKLNESIVNKVRRGMKAKVHVQSKNGGVYEGHVEKIAQVPIPPSSWRSSAEVKDYQCIVKIDGTPEDLRPGLTAELEVLTDEGLEILAVSPEAIHLENDRSFCYVVREDGVIEKREVRTEMGDPGYVSIVEGLQEGESVVRIPQKLFDQKAPIEQVVYLESQPELDPEILELLAHLAPSASESSEPSEPSGPRTDSHLQPAQFSFAEPRLGASAGY